MNAKHFFSCLIELLIYAAIAIPAAGPCFAGIQAPNEEIVATKEGGDTRPAINENFIRALKKKGYTIQSPDNIKKPEVVDNIARVQSLFGNKDDIFFSYSTLNRYAIYRGKTHIAARLYCFQFKDKEKASTWFRVIDNRKSRGSRRLVVFSKPKKLLGLAGDKVFLLEGYHISSFDSLYFILNQIDDLEYLLSPTETKKVK
jgi:hypothetical protein